MQRLRPVRRVGDVMEATGALVSVIGVVDAVLTLIPRRNVTKTGVRVILRDERAAWPR